MSRRGIGGTDLGAVCAYYRACPADWTRYATAADVWMRLVHDVERPRTAVMQRGLDAEPRLRRAYLDAYGGVLRERPAKWILQHPRLPFVTVSPDDVWRDSAGGGEVYVEWKSTSIFAAAKYGDAETDEVPDSYGLQVQLNLEILDLGVGHLFCGFGRDVKDETGAHQFLYEETRRFVIRRDRELMALALGLAERFHREHIDTRLPPSVEPKQNIRVWKRLLKEQSWKTEASSREAS